MSTDRFSINRAKIDDILEARRVRGQEFPRIGVFIVSYNASHRLIQTVKRIPPEILEVIEEIYVFDDFSTDDTFQLARELASSDLWATKLKAFRNPRNYGYGGNQQAPRLRSSQMSLRMLVICSPCAKEAAKALKLARWRAISAE